MFGQIKIGLVAFTMMVMSGCSAGGPKASITHGDHVDREGQAVQSEVFRVADSGDYFAQTHFRDKETGEILAVLDSGGRTVTGQIADVGKQVAYAVVDITGGKIIAESSEGASYIFDVSPIVTGPTNMNKIENRTNLGLSGVSGRNAPTIVMLVPEELQGKLMALLNGA